MSDGSIDRAELDADTASCVESHAVLDRFLADLGELDVTTPSRLPGWSIGHVLTHIARNADGQMSILDGFHQYPHGAEGRNADIESGASRPWDVLLADVGATSNELNAQWSNRDDWTGSAQMLSGERPLMLLPFLRQREVEIHLVDMGLGYEFFDMPARYVRKELRFMEMMWRARQPMGMGALPQAALNAEPTTRLAWMTGRAVIEGLGPAGLF
jgi:maleylpyruvate isomerase